MSSPPFPASDGQPRPSRSAALLEAALALGTEHELEPVLQRIVDSAATVADARYSALGRYDEQGEIRSFVYHGIDFDTVARIGRLPRGRGLLGEVIVADGPIRLDDLRADPRCCGFPPHHPPMRSFLGVPVTSGGRRYGNLYLTDKRGGGSFDEEDERLIVALAAFAAAAIENALLVQAEGERARVARDLHDEIGQDLTSVLLGLRLVETSLGGEPPDVEGARKHSAELRELVTDALGDVRRLAFELRPTVLDDVGLLAAVQRLAADVAARHGLTYRVEVDGLGKAERLPAEVETVAYRVIQEAVTNVVRHARAASVRVVVTRSAGGLRVSVTDDGVGFDPAGVGSGSLGLSGMLERAALVGGAVSLTAAPRAGTTVVLEVPLG